MIDRRHPECPHGGSLLRPGVMKCPVHHDYPQVGACNVCIANGARRLSYPRPSATPEPWYLAERLAICEKCENADCAIKHKTDCEVRAALSQEMMICPDDKWGPAIRPSALPEPGDDIGVLIVGDGT